MADFKHYKRGMTPMAALHGSLRVVPVRSDVGPYELWAPEDDHIARVIATTGRPYEEKLLRFLVHLVPSTSKAVVDVGANIGNHTAYFARRGARVIAVEANPDALPFLQRNVEPFSDRVTVWPVAAGSAPGRGRVVEHPTGQLGQMAFESDPAGPIEMVTLDSIDERVAVLKIDVEGGEESVLRGAIQLIRRSRPVIVVESWDARHRDGIVCLLRPLGYHRFPISLCSTPTYVYVPSWRHLLRAWTMPQAASSALSAIVHRVSQRIR